MTLRTALAALAGVASLTLSASAVAGQGGDEGTQIGQLSQSFVATSCGGAYSALQETSPGILNHVNGNGGGVITSFRYLANATPGSVRLLWFMPTAASREWTLVAKGPFVPVTVNSLNVIFTRIPVPYGAVLGLGVSNAGMNCWYPTTDPGDLVGYDSFDADTMTTLQASTATSEILDVDAFFEFDLDHDGYGDITQDKCPQFAWTQGPCYAPVTHVSKVPPPSVFTHLVKITFHTSAAGATFTCQIDRHRAKSCSSPFRHRYSFGRHKVLITAVSSLGIPDATPAKVRFRVRHKRH